MFHSLFASSIGQHARMLFSPETSLDVEQDFSVVLIMAAVTMFLLSLLSSPQCLCQITVCVSSIAPPRPLVSTSDKKGIFFLWMGYFLTFMLGERLDEELLPALQSESNICFCVLATSEELMEPFQHP